MKSRLATLLVASAALVAGLLIPAVSSEASAATRATTAPAAPCSKFVCDSQDPIADGCANTAITVRGTSTPVTLGSINYGTLQLRWSTGCKTNWGKFIGNGNGVAATVWVYRIADNKACGDQTGGGCNNFEYFGMPNTIYSNQLYGCNYLTYAAVDVLLKDGSDLPTRTPAEGGC